MSHKDYDNLKNVGDFHLQIEETLTTLKKEREKFIYATVSWIIVGIISLIFLFSIWNSLPNLFKLLLLSSMMVAAYLLGIKYHEEKNRITGLFTILGYIFFGLNLFNLKQILHLPLFTTSTYLLWGIVGLFLILVTKNQYLIVIILIVVNIGQIQLNVSEGFSYLIFIFIFSSSIYLFKITDIQLTKIFIGISIALQMIYLGFELGLNFSFYPIVIICLYLLGEISNWNKQNLLLKNILIWLAYIQQALFFLFTDWHMSLTNINWKQTVFLIFLFTVILFITALVKKINNANESFELLLFAPLFVLDGLGTLLSIIILLFYTLLLIKNKTITEKLATQHVFIGALVPLLIFTKITWSFINKPLYFLLIAGGLALISINIEKIKVFINSFYLTNNQNNESGEEL